MEKNNILETYFAIRRIINIVAVSEFKELGMGPKKAAVVRIIKEYPNISLASLASMTISDPATITRITDSLCKQNLVIKNDSKIDRRALILSLSKKGEEIVEIIKDKHKNIEKKVFNCLSKNEQTYLNRLFKTIISKHVCILKKGQNYDKKK